MTQANTHTLTERENEILSLLCVQSDKTLTKPILWARPFWFTVVSVCCLRKTFSCLMAYPWLRRNYRTHGLWVGHLRRQTVQWTNTPLFNIYILWLWKKKKKQNGGSLNTWSLLIGPWRLCLSSYTSEEKHTLLLFNIKLII